MSSKSNEKLSKFFEKAEYIVFRIFLLTSAILGISLLLCVEWSRLLDLAHLLGLR